MKIYVYIIWFHNKRKVHKIVKYHLKYIFKYIKYTFEVIKYFSYIYIFLYENKYLYIMWFYKKKVHIDDLNIRIKKYFSFKI